MSGNGVAEHFKSKDNSVSAKNNNTVDALKAHILNKKGNNVSNESHTASYNGQAREKASENMYNSERGHGINETREQRERINREHDNGMER